VASLPGLGLLFFVKVGSGGLGFFDRIEAERRKTALAARRASTASQFTELTKFSDRQKVGSLECGSEVAWSRSTESPLCCLWLTLQLSSSLDWGGF